VQLDLDLDEVRSVDELLTGAPRRRS
jgi:hypothetical protein